MKTVVVMAFDQRTYRGFVDETIGQMLPVEKKMCRRTDTCLTAYGVRFLYVTRIEQVQGLHDVEFIGLRGAHTQPEYNAVLTYCTLQSEIHKDLIESWKNDPAKWCHEVLGAVPAKWQLEIMRTMVDAHRNKKPAPIIYRGIRYGIATLRRFSEEVLR